MSPKKKHYSSFASRENGRRNFRLTHEELATGQMGIGNFSEARHLLEKALKLDEPQRRNALEMKLISLPFQEVLYNRKHGIDFDDELLAEALQVYAGTARLIEDGLQTISAVGREARNAP